MKEIHKKTLGVFKSGLIKLLKIIWVVLKSFGEAITWDFYENIKKYWKKYLKKGIYVQQKRVEPKTPLP